jgi:predicted HAD superfamily Cof-like phosphohydrolase
MNVFEYANEFIRHANSQDIKFQRSDALTVLLKEADELQHAMHMMAMSDTHIEKVGGSMMFIESLLDIIYAASCVLVTENEDPSDLFERIHHMNLQRVTEKSGDCLFPIGRPLKLDRAAYQTEQAKMIAQNILNAF